MFKRCYHCLAKRWIQQIGLCSGMIVVTLAAVGAFTTILKQRNQNCVFGDLFCS
jgi:hypothetical protein